MNTFNAETAWARTILSTPFQEELAPIFAKIQTAIDDGKTNVTLKGRLSDNSKRYLTELKYRVVITYADNSSTISW
jgi:hypothetical protein